MDLRNQWVSFRIRDVYLPDPQRILLEIHGNDLVKGKVADLSDHGLLKEAFAVIEVEGWNQPVIVPVERLLDVQSP